MKKGITLLALVSALFLGSTTAQAQAGLSRANSNYEKLAYYDALEIYEKIANRGFVDAELLKNLGNSYYFNGEYEAANKWYSQLFNDYGKESIEPEYDYRYAETLKSIGEDAKSQEYFQKFAKRNTTSARAKIINSDKESALEIEKNSNRYSIEDAKINSKYSDYGTSFYNNQVLFTTARDTGNFSKRVFTWTGEPFTKIYVADIANDGTLTDPKLFSRHITTKFNESTPVITKDGKTMYFTRNNYGEKGRGYSSENITLLKIYKAELRNGEWTNVIELPFNSNQFSTAHPVLNEQEDTMYFVSDRPGGFGSSDIWKVAITEKGFGRPENLGPEINTDGKETFPFITSDNVLYFATDARPGFGGLDVFASKIKEDGTYTQPKNVGAPINGPADDFGFIIDTQTKQGYFTSNRKGGHGKDDIYSFIEKTPLELECIQNLKVLVVDSKTRNIITDAKLSLFDMDYKLKATTDKTGASTSQYTFDTTYECGENYRLRVELPGYVAKEEVVQMGETSGTTEKTVMTERIIVVEKREKPIKKDEDLSKVLNLKPIHFDFDKDNIRPDAAIELSKIVEVMKEYPSMKIDVRSFTDSRGNDAYNLKLSERRAKSTAEWIISQGINSSRVTYKGFGETRLINKCSNGVKCTDEQHAENRRSEFIVVDL